MKPKIKIGIAISSYNRPEVTLKCYKEWKKYAPKGAVIVVVDDCSDTPPDFATYVMPSNAGIAAIKNKCIQLLIQAGCTHLFLSDNDTYPIIKDWYKPYIESGIPHLSFTFSNLYNGKPNGRKFLKYHNYNNQELSEYEQPCGCMIYLTSNVVTTIGGFDVDYPIWGMEHVDFSNRAHNIGLTPARYMDVSSSLSLFHSMDYHCTVQSSADDSIKNITLAENRARFDERRRSVEHMPLRAAMGDYSGVIFASYLNASPDPQRGRTWESSMLPLRPLIDSCDRVGVPLVIFHDCLADDIPETDRLKFVKIPKQHIYSPNAYRWSVYREYINHMLDIGEWDYSNVFMVDSTDVEVLRNPFVSLNPNKLYVGNEWNMKVDNDWMRRVQQPHLSTLEDYADIIHANRDKTLPNCGIVGGSLPIVMKYLELRVYLHEKHTHGLLQSTDMAIFNYIIWKHFGSENITSGIKVNTRFKKNEYNKVSFFKHK